MIIMILLPSSISIYSAKISLFKRGGTITSVINIYLKTI